MIQPSQCRAARALLNLSQAQVAKGVEMSVVTLSKLEAGRTRTQRSTLAALRLFFEKQGVEFIQAADGKGEGVRRAFAVEEALPAEARETT
ncbi:helix-turn-helix domain-containing protein [Methylobacterium nigriterrae]|uniref:helix-turn-helix domain-containing protein n=1 Tax=Methylobacterium nigriterrae TaxID=3127512 RepID=UPI0030132485